MSLFQRFLNVSAPDNVQLHTAKSFATQSLQSGRSQPQSYEMSNIKEQIMQQAQAKAAIYNARTLVEVRAIGT